MSKIKRTGASEGSIVRDLHRRFDCCALDVSLAIIDCLGTPFSRGVGDMLRKGQFLNYVHLQLDPSSYGDSDTFFCDYIASSILSKFPNFDLGINREQVAIDKFLESERSCSEASKRLKTLRRGGIPFSDPVFSDVSEARQKIAGLLGPFSWDQAEQSFGFGPGACIGLRSTFGDSYYKFGLKEPTTTAENADLAGIAIMRIPAWLNEPVTRNLSPDPWKRLKIVPGNSITTVPKSAKTDRVIAIEPLMNMYIQKGIGGMIRRKLKKVGVDLDSQELNQRLAKAGSVDGLLATVDLSSASDSVSMTLVEELLPEDWVTAIKQCRSPVGVLPDGSVIRYQKVSSMGNGYTFELESLIFWALVRAVMSNSKESDQRHAIYGDDLIVPVGCVQRLIHVLDFVGFKTNKEKTFVSGPFRESCGKHYFLGADVTPIYIRKAVDTVETLLVFANSIRRLSWRLLGTDFGCDSRLYEGWRRAVSLLPPFLRKPRIPFQSLHRAVGDGALIGNFDESCPSRAPRGYEGFVAQVVLRKYQTFHPTGVPAFLRGLRSLEGSSGSFLDHCGPIAGFSPGVGSGSIPRPDFKWRLIKTTIPRWEDIGPWSHELMLM